MKFKSIVCNGLKKYPHLKKWTEWERWIAHRNSDRSHLRSFHDDVQNLPRCSEYLWYTRYLLTPWCRVLLEKLTGLQLVKKFPAFHGTRRFIPALTSVRHLSLSWASPIQSIYPHPTSCRSILILSTHLRLGLPSGLFTSCFPTNTLYTPLSSSIRATCPAHWCDYSCHKLKILFLTCLVNIKIWRKPCMTEWLNLFVWWLIYYTNTIYNVFIRQKATRSAFKKSVLGTHFLWESSPPPTPKNKNKRAPGSWNVDLVNGTTKYLI